MRRFAVCLFGEPRTAAYCTPWQKKSFALGDRTDFFCDYKTTTVELNNITRKTLRHTSKEIQKYANDIGATSFTTTTVGVDAAIATGTPHYAKMMSSISRVILQKQLYEAQHGFTYDGVILTRHDVLVGPQIDTMKNLIDHYGIQPLCLHVSETSNIRFNGEAFRAGFPDMMIYGDSYTMDAVAANCYRYWATFDVSALITNNIFGPNVFLNMITNDAGLGIRHMGFQTAIVRITSDLTIPVFESWGLHKKHELESAVWNQPNK